MSQQGTEKIDLTRIPLFQGVEDAALGVAGDWILYFRDGQKIFAQGEPAESMIVILRGEIQVLSLDMSMVTRRQSDVVGEQGFLSPSASRTADAFARGTVEVLRIPGALVRRLLETNLQFNRNLLQIVSGKLADATSDRAFRYQNEHRLIAAFPLYRHRRSGTKPKSWFERSEGQLLEQQKLLVQTQYPCRPGPSAPRTHQQLAAPNCDPLPTSRHAKLDDSASQFFRLYGRCRAKKR